MSTILTARKACGRRAPSLSLGLVVLVLVLSTATYFSWTALARKAIHSRNVFETKNEFCLQDQGSNKNVGIVRTVPLLMMNDSTPFFDPFSQWTLRADVSNQTVREVLYRIDHDVACREALYYPSVKGTSSLEQIAASIQRKLRTGDRKIVVAVMGDSVAASYRGFIEALKSMLVTSPYLDFDIEMRNLAVGGAHVRYHFFCNKLIGDEDIVIFESVHLDEPEIVDLAQSLQKSGYGVLLITWRRPVFMKNYVVNEGKRAADSLNIPCLTLNERDKALRSCLPLSADQCKTVKELLFKDEVHPNRLGELTIAAFLGRAIEQAVREYLPNDISVDTPALVSLPERTMSNFDAVCFGRLDCEEGAPKSIGTNQCLNVIKHDGFQLGTLMNGDGSIRKQWWEGLKPGDLIELQLDEPCSSILLFHNLRTTNGMVIVRIDGKKVHRRIEQYKDAGNLPRGVLNGWRRDSPVLGPDRGQMQAVYIGENLESTPHTVGFEVLSTTDSTEGSHHFDFIALACQRTLRRDRE